jgi:hypothetical protein
MKLFFDFFSREKKKKKKWRLINQFSSKKYLNVKLNFLY